MLLTIVAIYGVTLHMHVDLASLPMRMHTLIESVMLSCHLTHIHARAYTHPDRLSLDVQPIQQKCVAFMDASRNDCKTGMTLLDVHLHSCGLVKHKRLEKLAS